jgi:CheY-like chemotaxis protein
MNEKVLIVDDSSLARRTLRQILEQAGYTVEEASVGAQALERYFIVRPDVVFLDMVMEGMSGMDVLARLREMDPNVRVIVATADIQKSTREQVQAGGAASLINKPLARDEIVRVITAVIQGDVIWS